MNTYYKYCPNVFLMKTEEDFNRGDIAEVTTRHGKENESYVHNLVMQKDGFKYYSITRVDGTNAQTVAKRKSDKYLGWSDSASQKSNAYYEKSNKDSDFLSLGEPIKIGHHSERRHRRAIENANANMGKCVAMSEKAGEHEAKAEYWASRTNEINLSMPESIEYFQFKLEQAKAHHADLKANPEKRSHSYSLTYANKEVKELTKKYDLAVKLWG